MIKPELTNLQEPYIQVGIMSSSQISFELKGVYVFDNEEFSGSFQAFCKAGLIQIQNESRNEWIFTATDINAFFQLDDVVIGKEFHWERKENQQFQGNLKLIVENNQITAINQVKVEDYLLSVISSEMSAHASNALLKAHAVISRSWLLHPVLHPEMQSHQAIHLAQTESTLTKWYERDAHQHFDVCADDHCQRYQGISRASTDAVRNAIAATRGQVLMSDGVICDARFSKCCGGVTELFENCWADVHHPYLLHFYDRKDAENFDADISSEQSATKYILGNQNAFCNTKDKKILEQVLNHYDQETTDFFRWKVIYSQTELSKLIFKKSGIDFGDILSLQALKRGKSGRITDLKITGTKKSLVVGKELEIRKWLSDSHLYSSAFVVLTENEINGVPQRFILQGAGWGHGVGLCQIGAAVMGDKGYDYQDILMHYYKHSTLEKLYE